MSTAMELAFAKSGLVSVEEIQQREDARREALEQEEKKKREAEEARFKERREQERIIREKRKPFETMWKGEKHRLLSHLIAAYSPVEMGHYAWDDTEFKGKPKKCCMCSQKLASKAFMLSRAEQISDLQMEYIRKDLRGEPTADFYKHIRNAVDGALVGVVSRKSDLAFCHDCFQAFVDWIEFEIIQGNSEVNGIIRRRVEEYRKEHHPVRGTLS
jgi:hypothetical protein